MLPSHNALLEFFFATNLPKVEGFKSSKFCAINLPDDDGFKIQVLFLQIHLK